MGCFEKFNTLNFTFDEHEAVVVLPDCEKIRGIAIKTEYWGAFPATEEKLVENGFLLCYIKNDNRWGTDADLDRKAEFVKYIAYKYKLPAKCVPVGMSCGGLFAIKFAAKYPELVSCLYIDAPVVNYMSCPCGFGVGNPLNSTLDEILNALNVTVPELLAYREMPLDKLPKLIENRIPVIMVAGDSDQIVPYVENGAFVEKAYYETGIDFEVYIKAGCDHHPHGLEDPTPVINFILKHV